MKKRIPLNASTFGEEEIAAVMDVLRSERITMGSKCREFEKEFGRFLGGAEAIFVNSGSSANLLTFFALANSAAPHPSKKRKLTPGFEVIVPAVTWSTTIWPIAQAGGIPVLVDSDPETLQIDVSAAVNALSDRTAALCAVHVLGNTAQMGELCELGAKNDLWVIEDTCEALGSRVEGRLAGTFGDLATFSFFFSHHITTIEGGMVVTNNPDLAELLRCMRAHGWTRDLARRSEVEKFYPEISPEFLFVNTGFNLRPTEINAVLGLLQIRKLEHLNTRRNQIAAYWNQYFDPLIQSGILRLMKPNERSQVASFGYPVMFRDSHTRKIFRNFLDQHGIETRPIICGNMARQPALKHVKHRISGDLSGADQIMDCGLMWGLHPMMSAEEQEYVASMVLKCASQL